MVVVCGLGYTVALIYAVKIRNFLWRQRGTFSKRIRRLHRQLTITLLIQVVKKAAKMRFNLAENEFFIR